MNLTDVPQHIIQRGNTRQATFFAEGDYRFYLERLLDASRKGETRATVNRGWPLGDDRFKDEIESALECAVRPPQRGRPARIRASRLTEKLH